MSKRTLIAIALLLTAGCDPDDESPERGELEWEQQSFRGFRSGDRVEFAPKGSAEGPGLIHACGFLTEHALLEIRRTLGSLDLASDYSLGQDGCEVADAPAASIHVRGAEHGPFECDQWCCRDELKPVALVYFHALNNLQGVVLEQDGERREVIDPSRPCTPAG